MSQINTVATVLTIHINTFVSLLFKSQLAHTSILPRIFTGINKYGIISFYVLAAMEFNIFADIKIREVSINSAAIVHPKLRGNSIRSHRMNSVRDLEPAKFGTILISPLSYVFFMVNSHIS